jgi:hypothetical protein
MVAVFALGMAAAGGPASATPHPRHHHPGKALAAWDGFARGVSGPYYSDAYGVTATESVGTLGTVESGSINPWRGAWNLNAVWNSASVWSTVDATGASAGFIVGGAIAPFDACYQVEPRYDTFGRYLGQVRVSTCS